jgi:hypothetical protein
MVAYCGATPGTTAGPNETLEYPKRGATCGLPSNGSGGTSRADAVGLQLQRPRLSIACRNTEMLCRTAAIQHGFASMT